MLLGGVALGLIVGLLAGGKVSNLVAVRLRWIGLLFGAVIVRFLTEAALIRGNELAETLRLPLFAAAYGLLLVGLWVNRRHPGILIAAVGILGNAIAIVANGGFMPVWEPSLTAAGFGPNDVDPTLHVLLPASVDGPFLLRAGLLGDVIPGPLPFLRDVISVGDLLIATGLAFFLFATLVRSPAELDADEAEAAARGLAGLSASARLAPGRSRTRRLVAGETGLAAGLAEASLLERPAFLGGSGPGLGSPALAPLELGFEAEGGLAPPIPRPIGPPAPALGQRVRRHPYVRLALNTSFSALWVGQLISLFGDRVHQIALAFLVLGITNSPLAVGFVFLAATVPNLLLGPLAGTLVDRWDHKEVMVASDFLRAAVVLLIPIAAVVNIYLVYPLVFIVTSISIFFRPARTAVVPQVVRDDELLTANSSLWVGETLADVIGYPLAGLFVAFVGTALPLAFWIDAASYVGSGILIATMAIPPRPRAEGADTATGGAPGVGDGVGDSPQTGGPPTAAPRLWTALRTEMLEGWHFLRQETVLLANTVQGVVGQFALGGLLALTPIYARDVIERGGVDAVAGYAFLETAIGVGSLVGGFAVGLVGARLAKGRLVIAGYALWGLCIAGLALAGSLPVAFGLMLGSGVANMIYVIPSQTLFQQRTPAELIGRVIGFRISLVYGSLTIALAVSGVLAQIVGVAPVIGLFGLVTAGAGVAGLFFRSVREA